MRKIRAVSAKMLSPRARHGIGFSLSYSNQTFRGRRQRRLLLLLLLLRRRTAWETRESLEWRPDLSRAPRPSLKSRDYASRAARNRHADDRRFARPVVARRAYLTSRDFDERFVSAAVSLVRRKLGMIGFQWYARTFSAMKVAALLWYIQFICKKKTWAHTLLSDNTP